MVCLVIDECSAHQKNALCKAVIRNNICVSYSENRLLNPITNTLATAHPRVSKWHEQEAKLTSEISFKRKRNALQEVPSTILWERAGGDPTCPQRGRYIR
jgi:hypothetical protein